MTVPELLRLAPFSLGTITILLAAGGLIFGHAYGRYGDDAAISFLLRPRFVVAALFVVPGPAMMLISFGRGAVPHWLNPGLAAGVIGSGIAATSAVVAYLLVSVSRPGMFLSSVGQRVKVRRVNRYALARRWLIEDEFDRDVAARRYRWFGALSPLTDVGAGQASPARRARWGLLRGWMGVRRRLLRSYRTDPSEMLFDAAAAGLKNGNMRTWRSALEVVGRRLRGSRLTPEAARVVIANAHALEESAQRQGSEDCKVRLCAALGEIGGVPLHGESAAIVARGISTLAERRLSEHRPVLAAVEALRAVSEANPVAAVRTVGWLGQHLVGVAPPAAVYDFDGDRLDHPPRALFALLVDLAERAVREEDGTLNAAVIDAGSMIARRLPGQQDHETIETLAFAIGRAGVAAARHYGQRAGAGWHGTHDAATGLVDAAAALNRPPGEERGVGRSAGIAEMIATIGCWAIANTESTHLRLGDGRSDMAALVAVQLLKLEDESVRVALTEIMVRQHNSDIPLEQRQSFIALCQREAGSLFGFRIFLDQRSDA